MFLLHCDPILERGLKAAAETNKLSPPKVWAVCNFLSFIIAASLLSLFCPLQPARVLWALCSPRHLSGAPSFMRLGLVFPPWLWSGLCAPLLSAAVHPPLCPWNQSSQSLGKETDAPFWSLVLFFLFKVFPFKNILLLIKHNGDNSDSWKNLQIAEQYFYNLYNKCY